MILLVTMRIGALINYLRAFRKPLKILVVGLVHFGYLSKMICCF